MSQLKIWNHILELEIEQARNASQNTHATQETKGEKIAMSAKMYLYLYHEDIS